MSREAYDDDCPDCRPTLIGPDGIMPETSPEMQIVLRVWGETKLPVRKAFHRVTCQSSQNPIDIGLAQMLVGRIQEALKAGVEADSA